MSDIIITVAVEDILSEAVLRRVLEQTEKSYAIGLILSGNGKGYLKTKAAGAEKRCKINGKPLLAA